jgi:branched-chain amino acid transport system permease protein
VVAELFRTLHLYLRGCCSRLSRALPETMSVLAQAIVSAIAAGAVYGLIAIGFSLTYRTTRVLNFGQGDLAVFAGYVAYSLFGFGLPLWFALLGGIIASGAMAGLLDRLILQHLYARKIVFAILSTLGFSIVLQSSMQLVWGSIPLALPSIASQQAFSVGGIAIAPSAVAIFAVGAVASFATLWAIEATKIGRAMRGCAQDREVTSLLGVNPRTMYLIAIVASGLLAGLAGVLITPLIGLTPFRGLGLSILGFLASILGGLGSLVGAMVGGMLVSVLITLAGTYLSSSYAYGLAYLLMALVLIVRVRGLFGDEIEAVRQI